MWSLICLHLLVAAAGQVHGIKLSLTGFSHGLYMCGTVGCIEETFNGETIKSLRIRKQLESDVVLVEMNQQQPSFHSKKDDRTKKGIWGMGSLASQRAEVQISLYNLEDCANAEFICEIVRLNKLGEERVSSSSGRINGKLDAQIIQELESKLEILTDTINKRQTTCPRAQKPSLDRYQVVYPTDGTPSYLCDTEGGWTVIQRRFDGKVDFYRNWTNYTNGFGSFDGEFWLGLEQIHKITSKSNYELMVTMVYKIKYYAHYDNFSVSGEDDNYRLSIGAYNGTAGDSLRYHNNMMFTTFDKDHDKRSAANCAEWYSGAWWYNDCYYSNLNGKWRSWAIRRRPIWHDISTSDPVTMTELKIRKML